MEESSKRWTRQAQRFNRRQKIKETQQMESDYARSLEDAKKKVDDAFAAYNVVSFARAQMFLDVHNLNLPLQPIETPIPIDQFQENMFVCAIQEHVKIFEEYKRSRSLLANMLIAVNQKSRVYRKKWLEQVTPTDLEGVNVGAAPEEEPEIKEAINA